ncbi:three prime repair exonuclease 2-like [Mixophyes fleayi]|uniref:three prime repair exonuclease 2-like n=1 Tax=Mixophyes fleayi TaxID=3061075 RepID=UPI003F4E06F7
MGSLVKTFIFLDLEGTGLTEYNPKITELALVAVHESSLKNPDRDASGQLQLPRVQDKICLCVNPDKALTESALKLTNLSCEKLSGCEKPKFDSSLFTIINEFITRQAQPVCLVAHNGFHYDFPLLKTELLKIQRDLSSSILCLDSIQALRYLDRNQRRPRGAKAWHSLPNLYKRYFHKEPRFSHFAEDDALTLVMVVMYRANQILEVAEYKKWGEISPMYM